MKYIHRHLEKHIQKISSQFSVLLLTGARQVGKTTLLKHISEKERTYITLDDPRVLALAKEDPALFFQRFTAPLLIDEIQYAPELLPYMKMMVDEQLLPDMFWLTGSQQFQLMRGVSESLAGRVGIVQLLGFSRRELLNLPSEPFLPSKISLHKPFLLPDLYKMIWQGSFPRMLTQNIERDIFFSSYIQTYLQRDLRDLARVVDEHAFFRFLRAAAARTGQILNMSDLARDADISVNTAKSWLSVLETSGIIYLMQPYFSNVLKRTIKTPKLYFLDTGLCAYLTEWSSPKTLEAGSMSGAILETWVICELLKTYWHNGLQPPFYYYRDKEKREIDLLIIKDQTIYPIECKKTASPSQADIRHFSALKNFNQEIGPGGLLCLIEQELPITSTITAIPLSAL